MPVATSLVYDVPLLVTATTTVSARAFRAGYAPSGVVSATFALDAAGAAATPTIAPAGGRFATRQTVTISGPAGATLRYTTSGADPTETDPTIVSGGTLTVDRALVLKVRAWQAGLAPSAVRRADVLVTGAVAASQWHSLALAADGTVWAWGANNAFQVSDGTAVPRAAPVAVFSGAVAIAAGLRHSLALAADGTVWSWGTNGSGQLGDGTVTNRGAPVPVADLAGVVAIAAGAEHSLAVTTTGEVWAWGSNAAGQLGDGTTTTRTAPVRVTGFGSATAVAAGPDFSLALDAQGAGRPGVGVGRQCRRAVGRRLDGGAADAGAGPGPGPGACGRGGHGLGDGPDGRRPRVDVGRQRRRTARQRAEQLHRLATQSGGGVLQFAGTVSEPATVTVAGQPATVSSEGVFEAGVPVGVGTNAITIAATDPSGNTTTAAYEMDVAQDAKTLTYDANGNLTSDGTRTFEWDARNQLVAVTVGTHRSEFVYDGLQRRVRQIEKDTGVVLSDTRVLWCETAICEERAADGVTVTRRAFGLVEQIAGQARYLTTDHLGSVREVTDIAGTVLARYAFEPWGRRAVTAGTDVTTVGFTGHRTHTTSGLALTLYRGYDAGLARWISEDPRFSDTWQWDGVDRYSYARRRPLSRFDPDGAASLPAVGIVGVAGIVVATCYRKATNAARRDFPGSEDKKQHCYAACVFNRCLLLQAPGTTFVGQVLHELVTVGWNSDSSADTASAVEGIRSSYRIWVSCWESCNTCPRP